ncbi:MAG: A/G-specific adenine glycosylase [Acidobacteria bacterium]|nr:A/G-specific adenine glycosylase [Acidobacteriota bacterium]MBV9147758.1 A/G-specific adenine glycosylase [Acidobacteriota bacterium]MBV9434587.1 A/G-specific adenine glycosylase [Acidobacteriota bacterium]
MSLPLQDAAALRRLRRQLLRWYAANRRDLPWRETRDPYRIWVSEIMLQQTRVAAVLEHYRQFLLRFPTVYDLAAAREAEVLAAWSGLGYYRRARMLHRAAKVVAREYAGALPQSALALRELPGIGRYTANAIASIAFAEPVAVVDGNVERVLGRLLGRSPGSAEVWERAERLLDPERPGDFNQAMMELGATVCSPSSPACGRCPLRRSCSTKGRETAAGKLQSKRLQRSAVLGLALRGESILLRRRSKCESLMPGMWELPPVAARLRKKPLLTVKHSITQTDWTVRVFPASQSASLRGGRWIRLAEVSRQPLTGLTRKVLRKLELLP